MRILVRVLLIWWLVLAIPVQGFAAATMASCGPDHHRGGVAAQTHGAAPAGHAHHAGATDADHAHHAAMHADEDAAAPMAEGGDPSTHKCSACASCCSVGAILSPVLAVPAPVFTPTVFSTAVPSVGHFASDGPDRPPRTVLA